MAKRLASSLVHDKLHQSTAELWKSWTLCRAFCALLSPHVKIFHVPRDDKLCPAGENKKKIQKRKQKAYVNCIALCWSLSLTAFIVIFRTWIVNLRHAYLKSHVSTLGATPYFHDKMGHCKTSPRNKHQFSAGALWVELTRRCYIDVSSEW